MSLRKLKKILQEAMTLAAKTRVEGPKDSKDDGYSEYIAGVRQNIFEQLEDFSAEHSLAQSIQMFLRKNLNLGEVSLKLSKQISGLEKIGKSGDLVFFVYGDSEEPILVVKSFINAIEEKGHFIRELSAFELLRNHSFSFIEFEEPLAVGKCTCDGVTYALLAKNFVSGRLIRDYITDVYQCFAKNENLLPIMTKANHVVEHLGRALGEFHSLSTKPGRHLPELTNRFRFRVSKAIAEGKKKIKKVDPKGLMEYVKKAITDYENTPFLNSYCHRDARFTNVLYNEKTETVTMIDPSRIHKSIDQNGGPIGDPAIDVSRFEREMWKMQVNGIPISICQQLRDSYRKGYLSSAKQIPPRECLHFYEIRSKLKQLAQHYKYDVVFAEALLEPIRD